MVFILLSNFWKKGWSTEKIQCLGALVVYAPTTCMTVLDTMRPAATVARLLATPAVVLLSLVPDGMGDTTSMAKFTRLLVHTMTVTDCRVCRVYDILGGPLSLSLLEDAMRLSSVRCMSRCRVLMQ